MNLSRLALVGCVLALCTASAQAQQSSPPPSGANAPGGNYADPSYADDGYAGDGYAEDGYCDGDYGGPCPGIFGSIFSQRRGLFYFSAEAIALRRDNQAVTRTVLVDSANAELFNTRSLDFNVNIGQRYTAGYMFDEQTCVEATYFSIDNWSYRKLVNPSPGSADVNLAGAFTPGSLAASSVDYIGAENATINYSARLINAELNVVRPLAWPDIGLLAGFRYLQLNEQMNIGSYTLANFTPENSDYNTRTKNNMYGGQIGARIRKYWDLFGFELTSKAGLFDNDSRQTNYVLDQGNSVILRPARGGNAHSAAFVGDINLSAMIRIDTNWVLRFGYNVLWIERVALAPDQLNFGTLSAASNGTGIDHHGGMFAHGMNAGLEARF